MGKSIQIGLFENHLETESPESPYPIDFVIYFRCGLQSIIENSIVLTPGQSQDKRDLPDFIKGADRLIAITGSVSKKVSTGI